MFFCKRAEPAHRQPQAEQVGRCGGNEHFCFRTDGATVGLYRRVVIQHVHRGDIVPDAGFVQAVDRAEHGIVFQVAHYDMVARTQASENGDIERMRRVLCKDDVFRRRAEQFGHVGTAGIDRLRRAQTDRMAAAAGVSAVFRHGCAHGGRDGRGLWKR